MKVLDTLAMVFKVQGAKEAKNEINDLINKMDKGEATANDMAKAITLVSKNLTAALAPLAAFRSAVRTSMEFGAQSNDLRMMAQEAGTTTETIQILGNALKNYGGDAASASAVIGTLNSNLQEMAMGRGGGGLQEAAVYLKGFDFKGSGSGGIATATEIIDKFAFAIKDLSENQQIKLGQMAGFDAPMIALMQQKYETLAEAKERAGKMRVLTPEDEERGRKYAATMTHLRDSFDKTKSTIGRALLPAITSISSALAKSMDWFDRHKGVAVASLTAVGVVLAGVALAGVAALTPLIAKVGILAARTLIAAAPWLALAAVIALVANEIYVFSKGGESYLKDFSDGWKNLEDNIANNTIIENLKLIRDFWKDAFKDLDEKIKVNPIGDKVQDWYKGFWEKIHGSESSISSGAKAMNETRTSFAAASAGSMSSISNRSSVNIQSLIINSKATDAAGIAQSIRGELSSAFYNTMNGAVA